jgi:hypothetical protein
MIASLDNMKAQKFTETTRSGIPTRANTCYTGTDGEGGGGRMELSRREDEVEVEVTLGIWVYPKFWVRFFGFSKIRVFRFDTRFSP